MRPVLAFAAGQAEAQSIGGAVTGFFGSGTVGASPGRDNDNDESFSTTGIYGVLGGRLANGLGFQIDLGQESGDYPNDPFFGQSGGALHLNYALGQTIVGLVAGSGSADGVYDSDYADVTWYGLEAARGFGDLHVAGMIGQTSSTNSHGPLDYDNYGMFAVEGRYFVNDDLMIRGSYENATARIHSDDLTTRKLSLDATVGLGNPLVYAFGGVTYMDLEAGGEGHSDELVAMLGLTIRFGGGGTLRDTFTRDVPMISRMNALDNGVRSSTMD